MNKIKLFTYFLFLGITLFSCGSGSAPSEKLPKLGHRDIIDGKTIYHKVPQFEFTNQYGEQLTNASFSDKAYIIDYFFTSCPTICPRVKAQELRIYDKYKSNPNLALLSVSIDPKYDDVDRLLKYANKLGVEKGNWHFVTGDKDQIYDKAVGFFHTAIENEEAPGGFDHDGKLVLIDRNGHIRGFCDALIPSEVDDFFDDIENLLHEQQ